MRNDSRTAEEQNKLHRLYIIGASGHGKVVADIAALNGYQKIYFLDDDPSKKDCGGYPVLGTSDSLRTCKESGAETDTNIETDTDIETDIAVFVAIGNAEIRRKLCEEYRDRLVTLIHPSAVIARDVKIGAGTVVMAGAVINPGTEIGAGCIINTSSSVDHDNRIGDYCHISVGTHLAGTVRVGSMTWIGAGATVSNNITICSGCMIGAGAVVVRDIEEPGTYVGVPAEKLSEVEENMNRQNCLNKIGGGEQLALPEAFCAKSLTPTRALQGVGPYGVAISCSAPSERCAA